MKNTSLISGCSAVDVPMTSYGASDEHPMSTRSASDGTRWEIGGKQFAKMYKYVAVLLMVFTVGIGQMWGGDAFPKVDNFENNTCNYSKSNAQSIGINSTIAHVRTGSYSVVLDLNTSSSGPYSKRSTKFNFVKDTYIHAIGWFKSDDSEEFWFKLGSTDCTKKTFGGDGEWHQLTGTCSYTSTTADKDVCIYITSDKKGNNVYFDDIVYYSSASDKVDISYPNGPTAGVSTTTAINWTNRDDSGDGATGRQATLIWKRTGGAANDLTLNNQGNYVVPAEGATLDQSGHWTLVSASVAANETSYSPTSGTFTEGDVYAIVHRDLAYNYSSPAYVTVTGGSGGGCTNVGIGTQPTSPVEATVGVASSITGLVASGTSPTYQWQTCNSDGTGATDISAAGAMSFTGYTSATLGLTPTAEGATYYKCVVSGDCGDPVTSNVVTVTASPVYSITYAGNGNSSGSMTNATNIASGSDKDLAANAFVKTDNVFVGWKTNVALTYVPYGKADEEGNRINAAVNDIIPDQSKIKGVSADITLTAQWAVPLVTYTMAVNSNSFGAGTSSTSDETNITARTGLTDVGSVGTPGSNSSKSNRTCKINVLSNDDKTAGTKYLTVDFTIASGKQVAIDHVDVMVSNVSKACTFDVEVSDVNGTSISTTGESFKGTSEEIYTVVVPNPSDKKFSGKVTVKITPYKGSGSATEVRLGKYVYVFGEVETIPESSDCSAYEFHYGPEIGDWETACFTQVGETNEWRIEDFTVPSTGNYYVGYHGDGVNGWNSTWSATKSWTDTYSDGNGAMVLLPGTSAVGQATNATGTLIIWSNSGDKNKYVGFKPDGYGITYGGNSYAFATTASANVWETGVVTLPDVSTTYTMGLATATEGTYVACAHSAAAEAISNMSVSNVDGGKKKVYLYTEDAGWLDKNPKMAVYDYTAGHACWGDGTEATKFMTKVNDNLWYGYVQSDATNLILVRVNPDNDNPAWDWGQSQNITLNSADSYDTYITITGWDGNATFTKGFAHPTTGQKGKFRIWDNSSAQNWYVNFVPYYTLSYDANGGTGEMDAAQRCAESSTLTVSVAANGFTAPAGRKFAGWAISQDHADAGTVDYEAGDDYSLTSDATLYAVWESNCPTTGTVFGWVKKTGLSDSNFSQDDYTYTPAEPGDYLASITGGTVELHVNADSRIRIRNSELNFNGGDSYIHVTSACAFQEGDKVNVSSSANTGDLILTLTTTKPSGSDSKVVGTIKQGTPFVIEVNGDNENLDLVGETEFYIWRSDGSTNVGTLTITRPEKFDVTYSSEKGSAPAGVSAASVTLAEIKGVSGWKNTGWKANVATEVAGETVDANTLIANGSVVTLSAATTFTAQWEQLYTITTGSHDHGTIAADPKSAVAGATITLTATPEDGYKLSAWDVYKTGEESTKVSVTNNQFEMPEYGVTISAEFVESVVLYDYSVKAAAGNKSFTDETVSEDKTGKSKTFGTEGNPQLEVVNAGWDKKDNIINSFIKFFGGTSSMSVVIPTGRKATVTIQYGSYSTGKYLMVNGVEQTHPIKALDNDITTSNIDTYMPTVELTNQTGTLVLTANASGNNIYIAYVDVTLTGNASYGVTYHLNDGAWDGDAGAATYTYGTGIATLATNVAREYYDFAGWFGNEGLTGDAITSIANDATGAKELWAKWTPKSYTLTWSWNGGACSATEGEDYTAGGLVAYGTALVYPEAAAMTKENTAFAGWSTDAATMPAEALTITAQWAPSHAITYTETKGAANSNPVLYIEGVGVASFEPLEDVANFHFTGWSPSSISAEATTDQTIEAQWVAAYNVSFDAGEGSGTVPATFQKWSGATVELPGQGEMVAPEGKIFAGWKANGAGDVLEAGDEYTMTAAAVEFVAQWKAVTLLINYDGENYSLNTTDFQTDIDLVDGVDGTGYDKQAKVKTNITGFSNYDNLGKGVMYHSKTNATKVTLYMYNNYTGNNTSTFYYTVVAEGETSSPSVTSESLTKNTGDSYEINMTGRSTLYVFCGQKELRISQIEVEENGTANKVAPEVGYSINLNKQRPLLLSGVATSFEGVEYKVASNFKPVNGQVQINALTNTYYKFTIPTGQTRQLQLTTSNTNKYTVSKTLGDAENQYQPKANNETKNWNLTAGTWYINPQGSNVNITNIAFDETPDPITVTFNSNGGSAVDDQALFEGDKAVEPTAPTKSGYRFVEWQLSGSAYDFDDEVSADITLDAVWQKVWTVTFDSDGGSDVAAATVDDGSAVAAPADPTKVGFDFVEWQLNSAAYNFASAVTSNITLVATWVVAQTDASLSALSYNSNAIDVNSAVEIEGVQTYTVHLQWGSTVDDDLISVTKSAETATVSEISYDSENLKATFSVESGNGTVTVNYAIQFVIDAKRGTSIVKAVVSGGDQKAGFDATGIYGDKGYAYTRNNKKLDTADKFVGVKLISGKTFATGDKLFVVTSTDADMGYIEIYEEAEGTNLIKATGVRDASAGITIPSELVGHSEFYIVRKASTGDQAWNGFVDYVEVLREMNPAIKSFKFGDDAAIINEGAKTISIDVPYGTDVTALTPTVEAYGNNGASYTPSGETDFTSPVNYVVTDAYGELSTTYEVTINIADPSTNADLASLEVEGYALDFDAATTTYNIVLNYGTTVLPTITYEVADTESPATATKVEGGVNGATTITVTPQAGAGYNKVYTINFSVSTTPTFAVFDGRTMSEAVVSFTDPTSEMSWTSADASTGSSSNTKTINGRTYAKSVKIFGSATTENRYLKFTVPTTHVARFYLAGSTNSSTGEQTLFFAKELTADPTKAIAGITASVDDPKWVQTEYLLPGTYYFCVTGSARIYELSVTLYPIDHSREVTQVSYGTICLPNGGIMVGGTLFEVAYMTYENAQPYKVFFDEVIDGIMEPAVPYIFLPKEDASLVAVTYTDNANATPSVEGVHGLHGTLEQMNGEDLYGKYIFYNNSIFKSENPNNWLNANRAYIELSQVPDYVTPIASNRRRVSMGINGTNSATGMDEIEANETPMKVMIEGQIYIIRGEKMYDVTGKLVK